MAFIMITTALILGCKNQASPRPWQAPKTSGGVVTVPLPNPPYLLTPSNSVPALRPRPHWPGKQDVGDDSFNKRTMDGTFQWFLLRFFGIFQI